MITVAILIPALNPDRRLIAYVQNLVTYGFHKILIIDDGSNEEAKSIFSDIASFGGEETDITILEHAVNLGKGRALKEGINYYLTHLKDQYKDCYGVITVDSDGQHHIEDVIRVSEALALTMNKRLVLGCRDFDLDFIPFKSKFGNKLTRIVFRFCFGTDVSDTQTGLRGFNNSLLPDLLELYGERFEYETNVLIECVKNEVDLEQITIQTIYENGNEGTHFDPIRDSVKIYRLILKRFFSYVAASFSSSLIDCAIFQLLCIFLPFADMPRIYAATVGARIISSLYNYTINKNVVFKSRANGKKSLLQYYLLCILTMIVSGTAVNLLYAVVKKGELVMKCIVDTILFFCNYHIQQKYVFAEKKNCGERNDTV